MSMPSTVELGLYEALTEVGIPPDAARKVERQFESAIHAGNDEIRAEMRDQLFTKTDGSEMENRLLRGMAEQTRWIITSFFGFSGLTIVITTAVIKLL
ncbi:hypothetical protein SAMN05192589_12732 [Paracidovorax valerianellae]|uniref:DUF1640 domain-containing protein n=2 Tax=Paracidovorax valerianellae TaxID=187868 RepID=A0A1G7F8J8_9BURK|nr:hypothetical protein SAMN05192589_12732 [Paracidovorax valerianellae]